MSKVKISVILMLLAMSYLLYSLGTTYGALTDQGSSKPMVIKLVELQLEAQGSTGWTSGSKPFDVNADVLRPGITVRNTAHFEVKVSDEIAKVKFKAVAPRWSQDSANELVSELNLTSTYKVNGTAVGNGTTAVSVKNGDSIEANITVAWPVETATADGWLTGETADLKNIIVELTGVG